MYHSQLKEGILWRGNQSPPTKFGQQYQERKDQSGDNYQKEGDNSEEKRCGKIIPTCPGANKIQPTAVMESGGGFKRKRKKPAFKGNKFLPQQHRKKFGAHRRPVQIQTYLY
jgi:hypothetical protein